MNKVLLSLLLLLPACLDQYLARNFGGHHEVVLTCGEKLVDVSWLKLDLWYATRPMRPEEFPETYSFQASSGGSVTIQECQ